MIKRLARAGTDDTGAPNLLPLYKNSLYLLFSERVFRHVPSVVSWRSTQQIYDDRCSTPCRPALYSDLPRCECHRQGVPPRAISNRLGLKSKLRESGEL